MLTNREKNLFNILFYYLIFKPIKYLWSRSRHLWSRGISAHSYLPWSYWHHEKAHSVKNRVSFCLVKGYDVTSIQLKTALLIIASKSLHRGKMKSHLPDDLGLTDNENPSWNILVHCVSTPYRYVVSLLLLQSPSLRLEPVFIRVNVHSSLWGISLPRASYTLSNEVPTFHFPLGLRQRIPSYSDSRRFAIDWPDG